ncbi:hypothetical protein HDU96_003650 [Phlyctochytrium bullatum]|nr:hypothetical protein HDU96_003650 [Phlyctochytrium bullatum]
MFSSAPNAGPSLIIRYMPQDRKVVCCQPTGNQVMWRFERMRDECVEAFNAAIRATHAVPDRLIYAFASRVFVVEMPRPIGGKRKAGFLSFEGETPQDVLVWIVEKAIAAPMRRGRGKILNPGDLLQRVVREFNEVLQMHYAHQKDDLDNMVLKGMRRARHLVDTGARTVLPAHLREGRVASPESAAAAEPATRRGSRSERRESSSSVANPNVRVVDYRISGGSGDGEGDSEDLRTPIPQSTRFFQAGLLPAHLDSVPPVQKASETIPVAGATVTIPLDRPPTPPDFLITPTPPTPHTTETPHEPNLIQHGRPRHQTVRIMLLHMQNFRPVWVRSPVFPEFGPYNPPPGPPWAPELYPRASGGAEASGKRVAEAGYEDSAKRPNLGAGEPETHSHRPEEFAGDHEPQQRAPERPSAGAGAGGSEVSQPPERFGCLDEAQAEIARLRRHLCEWERAGEVWREREGQLRDEIERLKAELARSRGV